MLQRWLHSAQPGRRKFNTRFFDAISDEITAMFCQNLDVVSCLKISTWIYPLYANLTVGCWGDRWSGQTGSGTSLLRWLLAFFFPPEIDNTATGKQAEIRHLTCQTEKYFPATSLKETVLDLAPFCSMQRHSCRSSWNQCLETAGRMSWAVGYFFFLLAVRCVICTTQCEVQRR